MNEFHFSLLIILENSNFEWYVIFETLQLHYPTRPYALKWLLNEKETASSTVSWTVQFDMFEVQKCEYDLRSWKFFKEKNSMIFGAVKKSFQSHFTEKIRENANFTLAWHSKWNNAKLTSEIGLKTFMDRITKFSLSILPFTGVCALQFYIDRAFANLGKGKELSHIPKSEDYIHFDRLFFLQRS